MNNFRIGAVFLAIAFFAVLSCNKSNENEVNDLNIRKQIIESQRNYLEKIIGDSVIAPNNWNVPLQHTLQKIASKDQILRYNLNYFILNDKVPNAFSYINGSIIISTGMLDFIDQNIEKRYGRDMVAVKGIDFYREPLMAALLAHEIAHITNNHIVEGYKKGIFKGSAIDGIKWDALKFQRDQEFDADKDAFLRIGRAGYDPDKMIEMLTYLKDLPQDMNLYLSTHPLPNSRLNNLTEGRIEMIKNMAGLELAFSAIQMGIDLDESVHSIEQALNIYKNNINLMKAIAIARHKQWMQSVSYDSLMLRGIISIDLFKDEMVIPKRIATKGPLNIPGISLYFERAQNEYKKINKLANDAMTTSSYALLLVYSDDIKDIAQSIKLARFAYENEKSLVTETNYATVLYVAGERTHNPALKEEAMKLLSKIVMENSNEKVDEKNKVQAYFVKKGKDAYLKLIHQRNKEIIFHEYTPLLNYALMNIYAGNKDFAKSLAILYRDNFESSSEWANHLLTLTNGKSVIEKKISVRGIKTGDSKEMLINRFGYNNAAINSLGKDEFVEIIRYPKEMIEFVINKGIISRIVILSPSKISLDNGIIIGNSSFDVEKRLGNASGFSSGSVIYTESKNIAIKYKNGKVEKVEIF